MRPFRDWAYAWIETLIVMWEIRHRRAEVMAAREDGRVRFRAIHTSTDTQYQWSKSTDE